VSRALGVAGVAARGDLLSGLRLGVGDLFLWAVNGEQGSLRFEGIVTCLAEIVAAMEIQICPDEKRNPVDQPFGLPAVLGAVTSAAEDENHWMLTLQFGELPALRGVVGKLIVGKDSPWNDVRSHI